MKEREREREEGRKTAPMFGNDPEPLKRIDVSQEFILIYGNGRWRPPGESFCSPINYSRPVDVDLVGTRILITSCPFFAAAQPEGKASSVPR